MVNGAAGGNATTGTVDSSGNYTAPASVTQSENVTVTVAVSSSPQQNLPPRPYPSFCRGKPSVPPSREIPRSRSIPFTCLRPAKYRLSLARRPTTAEYLAGCDAFTQWRPGKLYVAGMLGKTLITCAVSCAKQWRHLQRCRSDLTTAHRPPPADSDLRHGTPQPGIEMWNTLVPQNVAQAFATDLRAT